MDIVISEQNEKYRQGYLMLVLLHFCLLVARLLLHMYLNQKMRIRWGETTTSLFNVSNGVKQGGVLSPILFSIYIDELFVQLKQAGLGCYIGHLFAGIVGYADDINLLAPTKAALSKKLDITNQFGVEFKIKFNPDKSKLVIFEGNKRVTGSIVFNGSVRQAR